MEHRERFSETVIAEMRGVSDEEGRSRFGSGWKPISSLWIFLLPTT